MTKTNNNVDVFNKPSQHPLLITVVLDNLFRHLDFETLNECRKVCQIWRNVSEPLWCRQSPMQKIQQSIDMKNKLDLVGKTSKPSGRHDEDNDDEWAAKRYNKFELSKFKFGNFCMVEYKIWHTHGKLITFLELVDCKFACAVAFQDVLFCRATPILETLKLTRIGFTWRKKRQVPKEGDEDAEEDVSVGPVKSLRVLEIKYSDYCRVLPVPWESVLQCFIQLNSLALLSYTTAQPCELTMVVKGLQNFYHKKGQAHHLSNLNISEGPIYYNVHRARQFPDSMLDVFRKDNDHGLRLASLGFCATYPKDTEKCYELLSHLGLFMTRLKIRSTIVRQAEAIGEDFKFPLMQHLTRLDLFDYRPVTFKFLLSCPNLQHLNIIAQTRSPCYPILCNPMMERSNEWGVREKCKIFLPSMLSFHCNLLIDWTHGNMLELGWWMPALSSLLIRSNGFNFEGICQAFHNLKCLYLFASELTDASFTGITSPLPPSTLPEVVRTLPNITGFKFLQELGLHGFHPTCRSSNKLRLTKISVNHGLLNMSSLRKVHIAKHMMTSSGLDALQQAEFQVEILEPLHCTSSAFVLLATTPF